MSQGRLNGPPPWRDGLPRRRAEIVGRHPGVGAGAALADGLQQFAVVGEFVELLEVLVAQPDVVVAVAADRVRELEQAGAPRRQEIAVAVEDDDRMLGVAVEAVDPVLRVDRHRAGPHLDMRRRALPVLIDPIGVFAAADDRIHRSLHTNLVFAGGKSGPVSAVPQSAQFSLVRSCCSIAATWWRSVALGRAGDELAERVHRGAHVAEPCLQDPGLAPQFDQVGGDHQHRLDDAQGALVPAGLDQPRFEVVLQPQQDVAVGDRRVMVGRQLDLLAGRRLQQVAQHRRVAHACRRGTGRRSAARRPRRRGSGNGRERRGRPLSQPWARAACR